MLIGISNCKQIRSLKILHNSRKFVETKAHITLQANFHATFLPLPCLIIYLLMKCTFSLTISFLCCLGVALMAASPSKSQEKGKGKGKKRAAAEEVTLPPDLTPKASISWHTWTSSNGEALDAKYRALENGIVTVEQKDKRLVRFAISRLSKADQAFAQACKNAEPRPPMAQAIIDKAAARLNDTINAKLTTSTIAPNPTASDALFLRRIYLDTIGRIPTAEEAQTFLDDRSPNKRSTLINQLLNSPGYTMQMFNWLADMLRVKDDYGKGAKAFLYEDWLKEQVAMNASWDHMVREMLTADGKLNQNGAAGFLLRDAQMPLDGVANLLTTFLGANVSCAQCHDHPFADWSQHDFYSMAAFFGATDGFHERVYRETRKLIKSEEMAELPRAMVNQVLASNPYNLVDLSKNKLTFPNDYKYKDATPGELTKPSLIRWDDTKNDNPAYAVTANSSAQLRNQFADWMVHPENPRFATAIANRLWRKVFGLAVQEPVSDIDDPSAASNPELLAHITTYMKQAKFDLREFQRILFHTAAYQRLASKVPEDPQTYRFEGPVIRRMSAEQVWDSVIALTTGSDADHILLRRGDTMQKTDLGDNAITPESVKSVIDELKKNRIVVKGGGKKNGGNPRALASSYEGGTPTQRHGLLLARASEIQQPAPENHFLRLFGQSDRLVSDTNTVDGNVPQLLQLMNGPVQLMITQNSLAMNEAAKEKNPADQITSLYLSFLGRTPSSAEIAKSTEALKEGLTLSDIAWVLLNTREFLFIP